MRRVSEAVAYVGRMAEAAGVTDRVLTMVRAGEQLPLADGTIDVIHGEAMLHHLHLPIAGAEIARLLRKGGRTGFKDPLGQNPLLEFTRDNLPYSWKKSAKGTDHPLTLSKIDEFGQSFSVCTCRAFGFVQLVVCPFYKYTVDLLSPVRKNTYLSYA